MRKKKVFADSKENKVIYLAEYKSRKSAIKQSEQPLQGMPFSTTEAYATRIPNGQLFVDHFEDGTQTFSITGVYRSEFDRAMAAAIGLASFTRDQWKASEKTP